MSAVESRLAELGVELPEVAKPLAAYVPAMRSGDLIFTSGQLPVVAGEMQATGKVGADVTEERASELARLCVINALAAIKAEIGDLDKIEQVVKVVAFVSSDPAFTNQHIVTNGASEFIKEALGDAGVHARSAFGVASLPMNAPVEVELTVRVRD